MDGWGVLEGGAYVYTYNRRFTLLYSRSYCSIVKQLYSKKKKKDFPLDLKEQRCDREALTVTLPGEELDLVKTD